MKSKDMNAMGLDVGTSRVVVAQKSGEETEYRSQLNAFVRIPFSRITEGVLKKEKIPYTAQGQELVVHGNESERFADLLGRETRRPMRAGVLNPGEPESESQMREILRSVLGSDSANGRTIYFSVPAPPLGQTEPATYHEASIRAILNGFGYKVESINEGLAVIYGELEESNYTGIGLTFGGGLCNICLAYLSVPVVSFSVAKAGDFIDNSAAQATGELATRVRIAKENSFHFNGSMSEKVNQVLTIYYDDMIQTVIAGMKEALGNTKAMPKIGRPVPLVLSGGSAMPSGFRDRFEKALQAAEFPLPISEVRLAEKPLFSTAKGALMAALSEG